MVAIRAQVSLATVDGIPANYPTNSWAFDFTNSVANLEATSVNLRNFYEAMRSNTVFGAGIAATGHLIKYYVLPGVQPNYPQFEESFNLPSATTGAALPAEVAVVLSFQGQRIPGQEQARKRGRIYIPYIHQNVNVSGRPSSAARTTIATAAVTLANETAADTDGHWGVWSGLNDAITEVTNGWIDDAFDTQRRRGLARTTRTVWAAS